MWNEPTNRIKYNQRCSLLQSRLVHGKTEFFCVCVCACKYERKAEIWWSRKMWIAITMQSEQTNQRTSDPANQPANEQIYKVQSIRWSSCNIHALIRQFSFSLFHSVPLLFLHAAKFILLSRWNWMFSCFCVIPSSYSVIETMPQLNNNGKWHTK